MLFDTHAHYDAEQFDGDREAVLAGLVRRDVSLAVNPGCDVPSSRAAVALARAWPFLYAAVGYHPENCAPYDPAELDLFREWAKDPRVVAIGEIGLDYYWEENPPREHQRRVFRDQMALATAWRWCGNSPGSGGCSTAFPAARRWRRSWSGWAGWSPLPAC